MKNKSKPKCSKQEFSEFLKNIKKYFPHFDVMDSPDVILTWYEKLSKYEPAHLNYVIADIKYAQIGGFAPDLAEMSRLMESHQMPGKGSNNKPLIIYSKEQQDVEDCLDHYGSEYVHKRLACLGLTPKNFSKILFDKDLKDRYREMIAEMIAGIPGRATKPRQEPLFEES